MGFLLLKGRPDSSDFFRNVFDLVGDSVATIQCRTPPDDVKLLYDRSRVGVDFELEKLSSSEKQLVYYCKFDREFSHQLSVLPERFAEPDYVEAFSIVKNRVLLVHWMDVFSSNPCWISTQLDRRSVERFSRQMGMKIEEVDDPKFFYDSFRKR